MDFKNTNVSWNKHFFIIIYKIKKEYFGFILSSKLHTIKYSCNKYLKRDDINHLNKNSIIKCDTLMKFTDSDIKFKIGEKTDYEFYKIIDTHIIYSLNSKDINS